MFKVAVFVVVLTLVGGRTAHLLCDSWCHQRDTAEACHHNSIAQVDSGLSATDECGTTDLWAGLSREEVRRGIHDGNPAISVALHELAHPDRCLGSPQPVRIVTPLERRPLSTHLRI
jgi:hypothetical protein